MRKITINKNRQHYKNMLSNKDFTIFSSNCIGGVIYHILGMKFLSPTINLFMVPSDFIKFLKYPQLYFESDLTLIDNSNYKYPLVKCNDIILYCVHYKSLEEIKSKWKERSKRVNWNNVFVIMVERDGCSDKDILEFDKLPYKNKVVFVHKPMQNIKSAVYIPDTELDGADGNWVRDLTAYQYKYSAKRWIENFDFVKFFNEGK